MAVLLAIILTVATNDQFQTWIKTLPGYSLRRVWIAAIILVLVGVAVAIWQYARSNPHAVSAAKLSIGLTDPVLDVDARKAASTQETAMLFLLDVPKTAVTIVHCMFRLSNTGDHGLKSVRVEINYPEEYLVDEGVVVLFEDAAAVIEAGSAEKRSKAVERDVVVLGGMVRVSYDLEVLRFKETALIAEPLKFRSRSPMNNHHSGQFQPPALTARLRKRKSFLDYVRLGVFVFTEELKLESAFDVFCFAGLNPVDADTAIDGIKQAIWNDTYPQPGFYFNPFANRVRTCRLEVWVPQLNAAMPKMLYQDIPTKPHAGAISRLMLPPVDFRYTDAIHPLGKLVLRHPKRKRKDAVFAPPTGPGT